MRTNIEKVVPQTINGLEFYISNRTDQCAMSQVGLARLAGMSEFAVRQHFGARLKQGKFDYYDLSNPDVVAGTALAMMTKNGANLIADYACVEYLQYQANKGNKTAQFALTKFQLKGFRGWVREISGAVTEHDAVKLQSTMEQLMGMVGTLTAEFQEMRAETASYRRVVIHREGLKDWMELEEQMSSNALPAEEKEYTLGEYLWEFKKMKFDKAQMALFSNKVSYIYRTMQKEAPGKKQAKRSNGQLAPWTNSYKPADFPILDLAYKQTVIEF